MSRRAVFLDRDGTLIHDFRFIGNPEQVEPIPGAARAVRTLNEAGWLAIVVTNQSGIARGYFSEADYDRVRARLDELFDLGGAHIDASYMCPHHPDVTGPCECRKPGTLLYRQAAAEHDIDLTRSFYVGDKWRDIAPAAELGGTGILIPSPETTPDDLQRAKSEFTVLPTLDAAFRHVLVSKR